MDHVDGSPVVTAVIPCFNERSSVLTCLAGLRRDHPGVGAILVDDGSTDGTAEAVTKEEPWVRVLRGDGELWWSGAIALGIAAAREEAATHVVLLNNDTTLPAGGIARLVDASRSTGGLVSAAVADLVTKQAVSFGGVITPEGPELRLTHPPVDDRGLASADWLPGHALVVPMGVIDVIGLPDARHFPQYWGDTDYTMRAVRAGVPLHVVPEVLAYNDQRQTGIRLLLPIRPRNLWTVLTHQRSWMRVSDNVRFWRCHGDALGWDQLARRYRAIPLGIAYEVLDRTRLRGTVRRVRRAVTRR